MPLEVALDQPLDGGAIVGVEIAKVVGERAGAGARPRLEGGDELVLVDQAVLKGEQAEKQVRVGGHERSSGRRSGVTRGLSPIRRTVKRAAFLRPFGSRELPRRMPDDTLFRGE